MGVHNCSFTACIGNWYVRQCACNTPVDSACPTNLAAANAKYIWRSDPCKHRGSLTGVNDEQQLPVPPAAVHAAKGGSDLLRSELLLVLKLQKVFPAMPSKVYLFPAYCQMTAVLVCNDTAELLGPGMPYCQMQQGSHTPAQNGLLVHTGRYP